MTSVFPQPIVDPAAPRERLYGDLRALHHFQFNFAGNSTVGYYRVLLHGGQQISNMRTFVEALGGGPASGKNIRMGIYDQTDLMDDTLGPNAKVAETASTNLGGAAGTFVTAALTSPFTPPVTGWYWLALACQNAGVTFRGTGAYPAGFAKIREESTTNDNLPATAAGSELESAALYVAAVED